MTERAVTACGGDLVKLQELITRTPAVKRMFLARVGLNCIMRHAKHDVMRSRLESFRHPDGMQCILHCLLLPI
jgi:hypothetical protein